MKYTQFNGKYYIMEKGSNGEILLTPAVGLDRVKAWARLVIIEANEQYAFEDLRFVQAGNKVLCLNGTGFDGDGWGMAICRHGSIWEDDEFSLEVGKAIAYYRMIGTDIPGFVFDEDADN